MPALIETPEAAMRLARAICSDVSLYNEAKIVHGIEQDNFFEVMRDELEEGLAALDEALSVADEFCA